MSPNYLKRPELLVGLQDLEESHASQQEFGWEGHRKNHVGRDYHP
jgi:hypothetical protein